jgi:hypothetical protein
MLVKLFMDLWLHEHTYKYSPGAAAAVGVMVFFYVLRHFGVGTVGIILNFLNIAVFLCFSQLSILQQIGRVCVGATAGLIFTYYTSYLVYMESYLSGGSARADDATHAEALNGPGSDATAGGEAEADWSGSFTVATTLLVVVSYLLISLHRTAPMHLRPHSGAARATWTTVAPGATTSADVENPMQNLVASARTAPLPGEPERVMRELVAYQERLALDPDLVAVADTKGWYQRGGSGGVSSVGPSPMHRSTSSPGGISTNTSAADLRALSRTSSAASLNASMAAMGCEGDRYTEYTAQRPVATVAPVVGFCLCSVCLVNQVTRKGRMREGAVPSERTAVHCPYCRCCTLDADHHCMYVGNCVGRGNLRTFCWFLLFGGVSSLLWFVSAISTQYNNAQSTAVGSASAAASCLDSNPPGAAWGARLALQGCLLGADPAFFILTWAALALSVYFIYALYQQLLFVVYKTSSYYALEKRYPLVRPTGRGSSSAAAAPVSWTQAGRILFRFVWSGRYIIAPVLPDQLQLQSLGGRRSSSSRVAEGAAAAAGDEEEDDDDVGGGGEESGVVQAGGSGFPLLGSLRKSILGFTSAAKATS